MEYSMLIGRYQPFHDGHRALVQKLLDEGKNVLVAVRNMPRDKDNPYDAQNVMQTIKQEYTGPEFRNRVKVMVIPNITEVAYGRTPGWLIREIELDAKTQAISATEIRRQLDEQGAL